MTAKHTAIPPLYIEQEIDNDIVRLAFDDADKCTVIVADVYYKKGDKTPYTPEFIRNACNSLGGWRLAREEIKRRAERAEANLMAMHDRARKAEALNADLMAIAQRAKSLIECQDDAKQAALMVGFPEMVNAALKG